MYVHVICTCICYLFIAEPLHLRIGIRLDTEQSTIRSGVFNQLFIQYFNDQSAWGDQSLSSSSTAFAC